LRENFEKRKVKRTSFRGLYPYQAGEILPGHHRKREAQTIFTQVTDPNFSFGVVCGDSGCGKTSLLRCALQSYLREAQEEIGLRVLYISRPQGLVPQSVESGISAVERLQTQMKKLEEIAEQASGGAPLIIIIDQFEDLLIEYSFELRAQLGASLNALLHHRWPMRILCAIRRDYLLDMRYLAPELPEPFTSKTLFPLTNFTVQQAIDVIKECALLDDVELDGSLASIIANDLAEGGQVRPPELQIVCAALMSDPTESAYHLRGGARGILAHYLKNLIAICDDPHIGGQTLRTLCDFSSHTKRDPQTVTEITAALKLPSAMSREEKAIVVTKTLAQFETARIVQIESRGKDPTFALVHDYLVNSVAAATLEEEDRTSKANELLKYYIAEFNDDQRNRIPFRHYRFIKKYADKSLLIDPPARHLLRATRLAQIPYITAFLLLIFIFTAALVTALNTYRIWEPTTINSMLPEKGSVPVGGDVFEVQGTNRLLTIAQATDATFARLWDMKTAELILEKKGDDFLLDENVRFMLVADKSAQAVSAIQLPTGKMYDLPIRKSAIRTFDRLAEFVNFTNSEGIILISGVRPETEHDISGNSGQGPHGVMGHRGPPPQPGSNPNQGIRIWSILEQKELGFINDANWTQAPPPYSDAKASRLFAQKLDKGHVRLQLWNVPSGVGIASFIDYPGNEHLMDFAVDEIGKRFVVVKWISNQAVKFQMGDLQEGKLLSQQIASLKEPISNGRVVFSAQGDFVILMSTSPDKDAEPLVILNSSDLSPAQHCVGKNIRFAYMIGSLKLPSTVYWASELGIHVWDVSANPPRLLPGLKLSPFMKEDGSRRERVIINPNRDRVIIRRQNWRKELFDLNSGQKVADLGVAIPDWGIGYGLDDLTLFIQFTDGTNHLYSIETGRLFAEMKMNINVTTFYDKDCNRVTAWTQDGSVVHYTENLKILGRWTVLPAPCKTSNAVNN
jgi:GTPase SAR1 family protein